MKSFLGKLGIYALLLLLFGLFIGWGVSMIRTGEREAKLKDTPVTPAAELAKYAGTDKRVRVEIRPTGDPTLTAPNGTSLALQAVRITHEESDGDGGTDTVTDYDGVVPTRFAARSESAELLIDTKSVDKRFLHKQGSGRIRTRGTPPAEVAPWLAPQFARIPMPDDAEMDVYAVGTDETLTVYGTVAQENGKMVLRAAPDGDIYVISSLPFAKIAAQAQGSSRFNAIVGWIVIVVGVGLLGYILFSALPSRRKADTAQTTTPAGT